MPAFVAGNKENTKRPKDIGKWCDKDYFDGLADSRGYTDPKYDNRKGYGLTFWSDHYLGEAKTWAKDFSIYTFLDLGCGKGFYVQAFRMIGVEAWGIDLSEYATSHCHPDMKSYILCQDATDLSRFKDSYFDFIRSWDFLEHLTPEEIWKCLRECRRVGKRWMRHGITVFDKDYRSIAQAFPNEPQDPTHVSCYKPDWWKKMILSIFSEEEIKKFDFGMITKRRGMLDVLVELK